MEPLLKEGQEVSLITEFYQSNKIVRGDIVVLSTGSSKNKIIKKVYAVPGDKFSVINNGSNCSIQINGELVKNSTGGTFQYRVGKCGMLELYVKDYGGTIPENGYLILGEMVEGSFDSSVFGLTGKDQILGKACL